MNRFHFNHWTNELRRPRSQDRFDPVPVTASCNPDQSGEDCRPGQVVEWRVPPRISCVGTNFMLTAYTHGRFAWVINLVGVAVLGSGKP